MSYCLTVEVFVFVVRYSGVYLYIILSTHVVLLSADYLRTFLYCLPL